MARAVVNRYLYAVMNKCLRSGTRMHEDLNGESCGE